LTTQAIVLHRACIVHLSHAVFIVTLTHGQPNLILKKRVIRGPLAMQADGS
jgi:hypothetical protein